MLFSYIKRSYISSPDTGTVPCTQWTVAKYKIEIDAPENRNFWFASRIDFAFHFFYVIHWYKNCVETRIKVVQLGCGIYKFLLTPHRTSTSTTSAGDTTGRVLYTSTGLVVLSTLYTVGFHVGAFLQYNLTCRRDTALLVLFLCFDGCKTAFLITFPKCT